MEKFKIVFLDIDGVICTENSIRRAIADWSGLDVNDEDLFKKYDKIRKSIGFFPSFDMEHWPFDTDALKNIHALSRDPQVRFVISSTWRVGRTTDQLKKLFTMKGMCIPIIDRTPSNNNDLDGRGEEIKFWLEKEKTFEVESYVVIDDDSFDIKDVHPNNFVNTEFKDGFNSKHLEEARKILNR
jgi:hypothetical protein